MTKRRTMVVRFAVLGLMVGVVMLLEVIFNGFGSYTLEYLLGPFYSPANWLCNMVPLHGDEWWVLKGMIVFPACILLQWTLLGTLAGVTVVCLQKARRKNTQTRRPW
jgi:hypothetical protein